MPHQFIPVFEYQQIYHLEACCIVFFYDYFVHVFCCHCFCFCFFLLLHGDFQEYLKWNIPTCSSHILCFFAPTSNEKALTHVHLFNPQNHPVIWVFDKLGWCKGSHMCYWSLQIHDDTAKTVNRLLTLKEIAKLINLSCDLDCNNLFMPAKKKKNHSLVSISIITIRWK